MPADNFTIFGVRIDRVDFAELEKTVADTIAHQQSGYFVTLNGEILLKARHNPHYINVLNTAKLVIADSTNVSWVARWRGQNIKRIPGVDIALWLCQYAAQHQQSIFLLGAKPGIADLAAENLKKRYPNIRIAGTSSANPDQQEIASVINKSGAKIILVAYGAPIQETWLNQYLTATGANIGIGIGGTFDMLAGVLPRAPKFIRAIHLEWLWRLILQPSRWKRIWKALVVFPILALTESNKDAKNQN